MNVIDSHKKLSEIPEGEWVFIETVRDCNNSQSGYKLHSSTLYIQYRGGAFEEPYTFQVDFKPNTFNEIWEYEFRSNYPYSTEKDSLTLLEIDELFSTAYSMLQDQSYSCKHIREVE